jgi:glycosyltransferase domain-containing protein
MGLGKSKFTFLERLTIVIPTYNRQTFALRSMQYWSGTDVNIVVVDGTKKNIDSAIISQLRPNIKYIHSPTSFYKRMLSVIDHVETEYVLVGCDDEFYIPSALNSCIKKLSLDHELVTCGGRSALFDWKNNSVTGFGVYPKLKNLKLKDSIPTDRIKKHFSNYTPAHFYSVNRTKIWKIVMKEMCSKKYSFYASAEIQFEFLMVYAGKTLIIPELMWLRSNENEQMPVSFSQTPRFNKWWVDKEFKKEKNDFIKKIEYSCKKINKIKNAKYSPDVENCLEVYFKNYRKNTNTTLFYIFFNSFFQYFPLNLKIKIKKIFKYFGYGSIRPIPLINYAKLLEAESVKIDYDKLRKIEKVINLFYKKN